MGLTEHISQNLNVPFVIITEGDSKKYLCSNGVLFTKEEYLGGIDLIAEYERREKEEQLYDYAYAKSTGLLRKKRGTAKKEEVLEEHEDLHTEQEEKRNDRVHGVRPELRNGTDYNRRADNIERQNTRRYDISSRRNTNSSKSVLVICALLAFTSVISMYISTLHTATYLFDYVDVFSAWLMSASVTAYNATAFEVSVLFHTSKRNFIAVIFMFLWILVTLFSMTTTVSVFYDRFNFNEAQVSLENKQADSNKLALEVLKIKENDLREAISFKKKDIEYRQEREYATTALRLELEKLQNELQANLTEQQQLLSETPEVTQEVTKRKESMFSFLGRLIHLEGGILEFIMSALSAIFVNLIAPLSATAVIELTRKNN